MYIIYGLCSLLKVDHGSVTSNFSHLCHLALKLQCSCLLHVIRNHTVFPYFFYIFVQKKQQLCNHGEWKTPYNQIRKPCVQILLNAASFSSHGRSLLNLDWSIKLCLLLKFNTIQSKVICYQIHVTVFTSLSKVLCIDFRDDIKNAKEKDNWKIVQDFYSTTFDSFMEINAVFKVWLNYIFSIR